MVSSASTTCHFPRSQHNNHGSILLFLLPAQLYRLGLTCLYRADKMEADFAGVLPHWSHVLGRRPQCPYLASRKQRPLCFKVPSPHSFQLLCPFLTHLFDSDTQEISTSICITPFWSYGQDLHRHCRFHYANASKHITKPHRVRGATASEPVLDLK